MSTEFDIGHGVTIRWFDDRNGILWRHPGCRAWSYLYFQPNPCSTGHELVSGDADDLEHLTIKGSLLCPGGCGAHGLITNGRWVPA